MKFVFNIACLLALAVSAAPQAAAHSPSEGRFGPTSPGEITDVNCGGDCYEHSRWRSHYRWGSNGGGGYWHDRWRSHYRWSSYGGYWHGRYFSHYRMGSYHRLWRPCDPCGYGGW
jgi:hypothetical protein